MTADIYRKACYDALRPVLEGYKIAAPPRVVEISGTTLRDEFGFPQVTELRRSDYDLMMDGYRADLEQRFELVFADFVLEHVPDPARAVAQVRWMLRTGGTAVVTTCFLFPIHGSEQDGDGLDYFRFSPHALRELFSTGWKDVEVGSWGNVWAVNAAMYWRQNHLARSLSDIVDREPSITEKNDPTYPVIVWAVARKA